MSPNDDTQPPRLMLKSTKDALLIIEAAERGLFPRLVRRLTEQERAESIFSGAIFVYDEFESHIRRFTDTLVWSPSRIIGNYLVYREMRKHEPRPTSRAGASLPLQPAAARSLARPRPETLIDQSERDRKKREQQYVGSLTNNAKFKPDGLVKRTFSLMCEGKHIHVIAYYTYDDAMNENFMTPSEYPQFADLPISQELLQDKSMYRVPPRIEKLANGKLVYAGEDSDKPMSPPSDSVSLEADRDSPAASGSTGGTPDISTLPSLLPLAHGVRSHTPAQDESMFDLPPLRPLNARLTWDEAATPTSSTFNGPPYTTHSRSESAQYAFPEPSIPNTTSIGSIPIPILTPTSRVIPRLRDARQQPYPTHERPNNTSLNIARSLREPEHTPTDPSFAPAPAQSFDPVVGVGLEAGYDARPPSYHDQRAAWVISPMDFDSGGFGMRGGGSGGSQPAVAPVSGRTRPTPRPYEYEVGPSGERAEYDVTLGSYGGEWKPYDEVGLLYSPNEEGEGRGYQ